MMTSMLIRAVRIVPEVGNSVSGYYLNVQWIFRSSNPALVCWRPDARRPFNAMATLATPIADEHEWENANVVKVVRGANGDALYFSRASVPYPRDIRGIPAAALRHIGVYAYRRDFLLRFASLPQGVLERIEKLEQLRALENGYAIRVVPSVAPSLEIDTAEDLARARAHAASVRA